MSLFTRKRRQCRASSVSGFGSSTVTEYCTRERGHDGPHANAFWQTAWVVRTMAIPITYRYPYENLRDDAVVNVERVGEPVYYPERSP